jgi:hypothetical protein
MIWGAGEEGKVSGEWRVASGEWRVGKVLLGNGLWDFYVGFVWVLCG